MSLKTKAVKGPGKEKGVVAKRRVKAAALMSRMNPQEMHSLREEYVGFRFRRPREDERAQDFVQGELCIYVRHLLDGMRLPLQDYFKTFFNHFGLVPSQMSPNAMVFLRALYHLLYKEMEWNASNLLSLVSFASNEPGIYHLRPARSKVFRFKGSRDSVKWWKEKYVFVTADGDGWGFPTIPRVTTGPVVASPPGVTAQIEDFLKRLGVVSSAWM